MPGRNSALRHSTDVEASVRDDLREGDYPKAVYEAVDRLKGKLSTLSPAVAAMVSPGVAAVLIVLADGLGEGALERPPGYRRGHPDSDQMLWLFDAALKRARERRGGGNA